jgi:tetratricopeptide (TPR) repeat protein
MKAAVLPVLAACFLLATLSPALLCAEGEGIPAPVSAAESANAPEASPASATLSSSASPAYVAQAAASDSFVQGEKLFREDKLADAAAWLEKAVAEAGVDERAFLYLAASYEELGRYDEAVAVLRKGLPQASRFKHLFYYDMGNAFVLQNRNSFAEEMYGQAIAANANYAPAFLNRANVRIILKKYEDASADYQAYLGLNPQSSQKDAIEELLRRLGTELQARRDAAAAQEAQRVAAEQAKQALIDSVAASLKASAEETTSLSAGSGQVQGYGDELELDQ